MWFPFALVNLLPLFNHMWGKSLHYGLQTQYSR